MTEKKQKTMTIGALPLSGPRLEGGVVRDIWDRFAIEVEAPCDLSAWHLVAGDDETFDFARHLMPMPVNHMTFTRAELKRKIEHVTRQSGQQKQVDPQLLTGTLGQLDNEFWLLLGSHLYLYDVLKVLNLSSPVGRSIAWDLRQELPNVEPGSLLIAYSIAGMTTTPNLVRCSPMLHSLREPLHPLGHNGWPITWVDQDQ